MPKREKFHFDFECPECGGKGRVIYSENENPIPTLDTRIEDLTDGFREEGEKVVCVKCNIVVPH